jgi:hypothetical protein
VNPAYFSTDVADFLQLLASHNVRYLVVGGEAVIHYGYVRLTGDIDIYYESTPETPERLFASLRDFWNESIPGIDGAGELSAPEGDIPVIYIGLAELIKNKEASAREKDLDDLRFLRRASIQERPSS